MKNFPVPDLKFNCTLVDEIIETAKSLKSIEPGFSQKKLRENLDRLIFMLYDLDYYDVKEIEQYYIEKGKEGENPVRKKDMQKYCEEFIDTFKPFIREELFLTSEWATIKTFGTMVRLSVSPREGPLQYNRELEKFVLLIENKTKCEKKDIFKEKKIKFYDNNQLYIYKSNKQRDWTEFMAIKDANEELHEYFRRLKK
jgi:hypothetical protein